MVIINYYVSKFINKFLNFKLITYTILLTKFYPFYYFLFKSANPFRYIKTLNEKKRHILRKRPISIVRQKKKTIKNMGSLFYLEFCFFLINFPENKQFVINYSPPKTKNVGRTRTNG